MRENWLDKHVAHLSESAAREISRRGVMKRIFNAAFKGSLVVALGLHNARVAWAHHCGCSFPNGNGCSNCPGGGGCPSTCTTCTQGQHQLCPYPDAKWTDSCSPTTWVICYDCWCSSGSVLCGCKSNIQESPGGGGGECDGWEICGLCKCI